MGCDIHFFVEKRVNGVWESADKWTKNKYYNKDEPGDGTELEVTSEDNFYTDRNYGLFGILADVRNGRGFAGRNTGTGFKHISDPKGLPEDTSAPVKAQSDYWEGDGHSHSYFTLKEIFDYDWTQMTKYLGEDSSPYYKSAYGFWGETIPRMLRLGPIEDVRMVFWFDN